MDPETREIGHLSVAVRTHLTTRRFFTEFRQLYGRVLPVVISDDASDNGPIYQHLPIARFVFELGIRNRIERWLRHP